MVNSTIFLDILPFAQRQLWSQLSATPDSFVLYGGTALALQLRHRESIDFDFFSAQEFDPDKLGNSISYLKGGGIKHIDRNTLTVSVSIGEESVHCSFFGGLSMQHVKPVIVASNGLKIASILDVFGTKCATVIKRSEYKDYIDLIAILEKTGLSLTDGIAAACSIYGPSFNPLLALKAVTYTADLKPQLEPTENQLLLDSVKDVNLGSLPSITPLGDIGVHPTSTDKVPRGPSP
jgi:hypothetical protein